MVKKRTLVRLTTAFVFLCCFVFSSVNVFAQRDAVPTDSEIVAQGEQLFSEWACNTCHRVDQKLVGPALQGVYDRRNLDWIYSFIKNSSKLIASGDAQAVALYNEYNQLQMPSHDLEDEQILAIMAYVRNYEENPPIPVADATAAADGTGGTAAQGTVPLLI